MEVTLAPFAAQTTGMYYTISLNGSSESIYDGSQGQWADVFNVKVQAEEDGATVAHRHHLGRCDRRPRQLVFVLARRGGGASMLDDEYEEEDEEEGYGETRSLPRFLPMLTRKWHEPCSSSRSGPRRNPRLLRPRMER